MNLVPGWLGALFQPVERLLAANLRGVLDPGDAVVRTSRYLRLGMVGMVLGLAASLFFELNRVRHLDHGKGCLLDSISAYYYTPVHAYFVGALVTIGVSLIAIRGNTTAEDLLLNFAGACAPFVAWVPTDPAPTTCHPTLDTTDRTLNIANNVGALFVVAAAALLTLGVLLAVSGYRRSRVDAPSVIAYLIVVAAYVAAIVLFLAERPWFSSNMHEISAISMFTLLAINAFVNGYNLYQTRRHPSRVDQPPKRRVGWFNLYTAVGTFMVLAAIVFGFVFRQFWHQWVFGLEATEIGLFAVFWLRQTIELWDEGLRPPPGPGAPGQPSLPEAG
jgi:hypothetical protein